VSGWLDRKGGVAALRGAFRQCVTRAAEPPVEAARSAAAGASQSRPGAWRSRWAAFVALAFAKAAGATRAGLSTWRVRLNRSAEGRAAVVGASGQALTGVRAAAMLPLLVADCGVRYW